MKKFIIDQIKCQKGSFVVDIFPLLPLFGLSLALPVLRYLYKYCHKTVVKLTVVTMVNFWLIAGALYLDLLKFSFLSPLTGNDFMWNWPVYPLWGFRIVPLADIPTYADFWGFWNLLALFLFFVVYPLVLYLGVQLGYLLFGRSEKQKGVIDLLFYRDNKLKYPFN